MSTAEIEIPGLELLTELGRGAYSIVYRARRGDRDCAVKVARRGGRTSRWFRREAAALARVKHHGVPEVLDVGELDGRAYLVMALVEGETLASRLDREPMSIAGATRLGLELARVAEAVHARDLVHRDIKPGNIVIEPTGRVRLVDFGLVSHLHPILGLADVAGTRSYAAPEQLRAPQLVDARADLYALGRVLQECVGADSEALTGPLEEIVEHLLSESPAERYPSATVLIADLERAELDQPPQGPGGGDPLSERRSTPVVGRDAELSRVQAAWAQARAGRGGMVLIEGPAGSGKTRLIRELLQTSSDRGPALALQATTGSQRPFAVLGHLVDRFLDRGHVLPVETRQQRQEAVRAAAEGPVGPLVASISPELARVLGDPPPPVAAAHEAFVEASAGFLVRLARASGPILIAVDDLQWIDPVSREVLVRVAVEAQRAPLLLAATARTGGRELPSVRRFLRAVADDQLTVITLAGLEEAALRELSQTYLGREPDGALLRWIAGVAEGTPLGVLEVLGALIDGGALWPHWGSWRFDLVRAQRIPLPGGITGLLEARVGQLPPATVRVLQAAAVIGPRFETRRVANAVEVEVDDLGFALVEAGRAGLVELDREGRPRFVHETVREALLRPLSGTQLRALHQRVAEVLDAEGSDEPEVLFAAARHFAAGEPGQNPPRVYVAAMSAATKALVALDHESALEFSTLARDAARRAHIELDREFHRNEAESRIGTGDLDGSLASLELCLDQSTGAERALLFARIAWVHQTRSDPEQAWEALAQAFDVLSERMPTERPRALTQSAIAFVRSQVASRREAAPKPDARERLEVLCDLHYQNARLGVEYDKPLRIVQSALAVLRIGKRLGPSATMARAHAMYAVFMAVLGRRGAAHRYLATAQTMAEELGDPAALAQTSQFALMVSCFAGDLDEALDWARKCLDTYGHWLEVNEYCLDALSARLIEAFRGRPRRALAWLERAHLRIQHLETPPPINDQLIAPCIRAAEAALGRPRSVSRRREPLSSTGRTPGFYRIAAWGPRAGELADTGRLDELEGLVEAFEAEGHNPRRVHVVVAEYYLAVAHAHAMQCLRAAPRERGPLLKRLQNALSDLRKAARIPLLAGHVRVLEGYGAFFKQDHATARRHFAEARTLGDREQAPWVLYAVARGEAHLLREEGQYTSARERAQEAARVARDQGTVHQLAWIREEFGLQEASSSSSSRSSSRASSRGRQLRALTHVLRATAQELHLEPQVRSVLDELIGAVASDRALILFERTDQDPTRLLRGRTADGSDWEPSDPATLDLLKRSRDAIDSPASPESDPEGIDPDRTIVVPLSLQHERVGALLLSRNASSSAFSAEDVDLVVAIAPQIPVALELGRLLEQRDKLQETLRHAQKMEAVGQLASGIAHDFNNMLTAIFAALDTVEPATGEGELGGALDTIRDSSRRASELTRQLLAFSRRQVLDMTIVDAGEVLTALLPFLQRLLGRHFMVHYRSDPGRTTIRTDRSSLEHAIVNLVVNARDAMPGGGEISIRVGETPADASEANESTGPYVRIQVRDAGTGIPEDLREKVFEPFFTTKPLGAGTGLGLASVYGFVKQCGGHIEVDSEVDVGSTFTIDLPAVEGVVAVPTPRRASKPVKPVKTASLLFVEDEPLVRTSLTAALRRDGFTVHAASDGGAALELIKSGIDIDLVVTDVMMPVMDGPELALRLVGEGCKAPVLFVSGYADGQLVERGVLHDDVEFMHKPFRYHELTARISEILGREHE